MEKYESPTIKVAGGVVDPEGIKVYYEENVVFVGEAIIYATLAGVMHGALFLVVLVTAALVLLAGKVDNE